MQQTEPMGSPSPSPKRPVRLLSGETLAVRAALIILFALLLFNVAFTPNFLSVQTFNLNLTQVATIVIVGCGMTLVIATGGVDLSVGSLMAISGAIAPMLFLDSPALGVTLGVALALAIPVLVAGAFGWLNGIFITALRLQPIVATLVLFIAGRGIAQVITNGNLRSFSGSSAASDAFSFIGQGRPLGVPFQVFLMLMVVVFTAWLLRRTVFGRQVLAVGGNEKAARLAGVPVTRVKLLVYMFSGLLAGLAGLIVIAINRSSDANQVGQGMELDAIAAVAVGGTLLSGGRATVIGTLLGALIMQLIRYTLLAKGVPDAAALVVKAAIIVAAVALQGRRSS